MRSDARSMALFAWHSRAVTRMRVPPPMVTATQQTTDSPSTGDDVRETVTVRTMSLKHARLEQTRSSAYARVCRPKVCPTSVTAIVISDYARQRALPLRVRISRRDLERLRRVIQRRRPRIGFTLERSFQSESVSWRLGLNPHGKAAVSVG